MAGIESKSGAPLAEGTPGSIESYCKDNQILGKEKIEVLPDIIQVGDYYEKTVVAYDANGRPHDKVIVRKKEALIDEYGKNYVMNIRRFDCAVVVPSHTDYKTVLGKCINRYHRLEIEPCKGDHPTWDILIRRTFMEQFILGMDYLTIAYRFPTQVLPVLCLISKENGTGKSTMGNGLSYLFGLNVGFYGQDDLSSQFNGWLMKLFAVFEEISETKSTLNKIKNFSTAKNVTINIKYQPQFSFTSFIKLVILTNSERSFIRANEHDIRYWVRRLEPIAPEDFDPEFESKLQAEAPMFLHTLHTREISVPKASRMWFAPNLIHTEALDVVRAESKSDVIKDLEVVIEEKCSELGAFYATASDMAILLRTKHPVHKVSAALRDMGLKAQKQMRFTDVFGAQNRNGTPYLFTNATTTEVPEERDLGF